MATPLEITVQKAFHDGSSMKKIRKDFALTRQTVQEILGRGTGKMARSLTIVEEESLSEAKNKEKSARRAKRQQQERTRREQKEKIEKDRQVSQNLLEDNSNGES